MGSRARLEVEAEGQIVDSLVLPVVERAPAIFVRPDRFTQICRFGAGTIGFSAYLGAILNEDGRINSCEQPAGPGSVIAVFLHGVGITNAAPAEGTVQSAPLAPLNLPVEASVNGFPAEVVFAGGSPGQAAGLWQVNVRIPEGLTGGALIRVRVAGRAVRPPQVLAWVGP